MKIAIRATNWIGDAVMSLPALRAIRARFPAAEIIAIAKPWVAALYEGEQSIDRLIQIDASRWKTAKALRRERFDLAILFPNSFDSAFTIFLSGARKRIGYAHDGRSLLLTDAIQAPRNGELPPHERFYYLELLRRAGLITCFTDDPDIRFDSTVAAQARGQALLRARGIALPVVGVSPGAAYGNAKRWLPERFARRGEIGATRRGFRIGCRTGTLRVRRAAMQRDEFRRGNDAA